MKSNNNYDAILKEMFGLQRFGIKLGLATIRNILKGLGNPQRTFASIHIAGTNGKGSIAAGIASILQYAGYRTGLYTSPHLIDFNERICINGKQISNKEVVTAYQAVKKVHKGSREPTFFEFTTAMALYEFGRQQVDWAIIETGMGGRLDATNIIKPAVSIISNISLEHKMYLGNTIAQIAAEKGGIIKSKTPAITGARQDPALSVLKAIAEDKSAPFYQYGKNFRVRRNPNGSFNYYGLSNVYKNLLTSLIGPHQITNAALVLAACEILAQNKRINLTESHLRFGLQNTIWPGRLEFVSESPLIILDGAHNLAAARNLANYLQGNLRDRKLTLVAGILNDKPYKAMLRPLMKQCRRIIVTRPLIDRALEPEILYQEAKRHVSDVTLLPGVDQAVTHALATANSDDVICIAGSLYVVGEAKQTLARLL
jgi:dihydrofolate synthase/folylpolyglutamate synthase